MDPEIYQKLVDARLKALEADVRRLRAALGWPLEEPVGGPAPGAAPAGERAPASVGEPAPASEAATGVPVAPHVAPDPAVPGGTPVPGPRPKPGRDVERWLGENGLLVVGLLALVATAGFLIKYAFDQGWVSPAFRVTAGIVTGLGITLYGERIRARGLAAFGNALIGGGSAIAYVSLWAAAGPYAFFSPVIGIVALAALSGIVVYRASASATEYLAALAAVGAYMAPLILGNPESSPDVLAIYSGAVAVGCGWVALRHGWSRTFGLVAFFALLLPAVGATDGTGTAPVSAYLPATATAGLWTARSRDWDGAYALTLIFAWGALAIYGDIVQGLPAWLLVCLLPAVAMPTFLDALRREATGEAEAVGPGAPAARLRTEWGAALLLSAFAWSGVTLLAAPPPLEPLPLAMLAVIAVPYGWLAYTRQLAGPTLIWIGLLAWGIEREFTGVGAPAAWGILAVVSTLLTRPRAVASARWAPLALGLLGAARLFGPEAIARPEGARAFVDGWSVGLYLMIAGLALPAGPLWGRPPPVRLAGNLGMLRRALWIAAGLAVLVGGTQEIGFAFETERLAGVELAHDLTVSAFWLVYAGALFAFGFARDQPPVRVAGLVVTGLALGKILVQDLTELEALYRVGALALLAGIALAAARAYHLRARQE